MGVDFAETLKKGFSLLGYYVLFVVLGVIFIGPGFMLTSRMPALGIPLMLLGYLFLIAGMFGVTYKLIIDAIEKGNLEVTIVEDRTDADKQEKGGLPESE